MVICIQIKMLILQDGFYNIYMKKYKPKEKNIKKLELFLKKIENKKDGIKFSKY
jgi:hypothetical protein